jgi:hypothetical protein
LRYARCLLDGPAPRAAVSSLKGVEWRSNERIGLEIKRGHVRPDRKRKIVAGDVAMEERA